MPATMNSSILGRDKGTAVVDKCVFIAIYLSNYPLGLGLGYVEAGLLKASCKLFGVQHAVTVLVKEQEGQVHL